MLSLPRNLKWRGGAPRVLADFLTVHASMLLALAVSVTYRTALGHGVEAQQLIAGFRHYYVTFFWLLSPIFPAVFLFNGFYTYSRAYVGKQKAWVILRGVTLAVMLFYTADFLLFQLHSTGRSVALPFVVLARLRAMFRAPAEGRPRKALFAQAGGHGRRAIEAGAGGGRCRLHRIVAGGALARQRL